MIRRLLCALGFHYRLAFQDWVRGEIRYAGRFCLYCFKRFPL